MKLLLNNLICLAAPANPMWNALIDCCLAQNSRCLNFNPTIQPLLPNTKMRYQISEAMAEDGFDENSKS